MAAEIPSVKPDILITVGSKSLSLSLSLSVMCDLTPYILVLTRDVFLPLVQFSFIYIMGVVLVLLGKANTEHITVDRFFFIP